MGYPPSGGGSNQGLGGGVVYVGQNGSDANDGSSLQRAKLTGYAAAKTLIERYGGGALEVFGAINWGGTDFSGESGIWFRGDGADITGWLPMAQIVINGHGQSTSNLFQRPGQAIITAGGYLGRTFRYRRNPAVWISKSQNLITFNNVRIPNSTFCPSRVAMDYFRNPDGTIQQLQVTNATRTANVTTYTVTLPTGIGANSFSRTSNVVTVVIANPAGKATFPPWRPGQKVRVTTGGDTDFPNIDATVLSCNATLESSSDWSFTYTQSGSNHSTKVIAGATVKSHGCGATGEGEYLDLESIDADFPNGQYRVIGHTVDTITVTDPWGGQPNNAGGTCPASATGTNIGPLMHQERVYCAVQQPIFNNFSFNMPTGALWGLYSTGPGMDFGANISLGPEIYNSQLQAVAFNSLAAPRDNDRMAAVFMSPGSANNPTGFSLICENSGASDGGIRVLTGLNGGVVRVKNWVGEAASNTSIQPGVDVVGNGFVEVYCDSVVQADMDNTLPNVRVTSTPPGQVELRRCGIVDVQRGGLCGSLLDGSWVSNPAPANPWTKGQITNWATDTRITGNHPAGRRTMGPVGARFSNRLSPMSAWSGSGGVTLSPSQVSPDGAGTAMRASGAGTVTMRGNTSDASVAFEVGGRYVIGGWFNAASGFDNVVMSFVGTAGQITFANTGNEGFQLQASYNGNGFQSFAGYGLVATVPGGATQTYSITANSIATAIDFWGTFGFYVPASIPDNDFFEFLGTLKHQPIYLPAGFSGTMEGQKFVAHGGLATANYYTVGGGAGQITIGAAAAKAIEVFDEAGNSLGVIRPTAFTVN